MPTMHAHTHTNKPHTCVCTIHSTQTHIHTRPPALLTRPTTNNKPLQHPPPLLHTATLPSHFSLYLPADITKQQGAPSTPRKPHTTTAATNNTPTGQHPIAHNNNPHPNMCVSVSVSHPCITLHANHAHRNTHEQATHTHVCAPYTAHRHTRTLAPPPC